MWKRKRGKKNTRRCFFPHVPEEAFGGVASLLFRADAKFQLIFRFSFSSRFRWVNHSLQKQFSCNVRNIRWSQFKAIFALLVEPQMRMPHERIKLTRQWRWNGRRQLSRDKFEKVEFNFLSPPKTIWCVPECGAYLLRPMEIVQRHSQNWRFRFAEMDFNFRTVILYIRHVMRILCENPTITLFAKSWLNSGGAKPVVRTKIIFYLKIHLRSNHVQF